MYTTDPTLTTSPTPSATGGADAWLLWRPDALPAPEVLTVAELAECRCPDLCDRDHGND